jgi:hypothetical protein
MGTPSSNPPGSAMVTPAEPTKTLSQGVFVYHVICRYHGLTHDCDSMEDALEAAADHLRQEHSSAVEAKSNTAEVEITEGIRFRVSDIEGEEKPKE